jgi:trk system potassium uptake protein TrkH
MIRGKRTVLLRDTEWRIFIGVLSAAIVLITVNLMFGEHQGSAGADGGYTFLHALRAGAFQATSIMTSTGYSTDNFDVWPHFSRTLIVVLMFVGGCAGSTAGGMKILRLIILAKIAYWRLEQTFRPKTIRAVRVSGQVVGDDIQRRVLTFLVLFLVWLAGGTLFMSALGLPFETALSSVIVTLNNIGPGIDLISADSDFSEIPVVGKMFLTLCMALGRLEMFSVCVLFIPSFWKHS